uniref:Uncharacterized protein n=1 Tax=Siphoviridae sp. ct0uL16 TaxID=2825299 RepID=A0A8S5Q4L7_9CAUD|nr:MAG TPA: hypothetical protein [Siphoviridae sp. ct0uL16]
MKTCKDCLHFPFCENNTKFSPLVSSMLTLFPEVAKSCNLFKDRSEWVRLPVKIGDYLYTNISSRGLPLRTQNNPQKVEVVSIILLNSESMGDGLITVSYESKETYNFYFSNIGKTVFFTREEAEKMPKEREDNA